MATIDRTKPNPDCDNCDGYGSGLYHADGPCAACWPDEATAWNRRQPAPASGWVSVEDALPENEERVLVASRHENSAGESRYYIVTNYFLVPEMRWANDALIDGITHWMPLPEPPKEHA